MFSSSDKIKIDDVDLDHVACLSAMYLLESDRCMRRSLARTGL